MELCLLWELRSEEIKYSDNLILFEMGFYIYYIKPLRESGIFVSRNYGICIDLLGVYKILIDEEWVIRCVDFGKIEPTSRMSRIYKSFLVIEKVNLRVLSLKYIV